MKIVFIGTFSYEQVKEIKEFLHYQNATDRETKNNIIDFRGEQGRYTYKIVVDSSGSIEKIIIRNVKEK